MASGGQDDFGFTNTMSGPQNWFSVQSDPMLTKSNYPLAGNFLQLLQDQSNPFEGENGDLGDNGDEVSYRDESDSCSQNDEELDEESPESGNLSF
jgi:hypothetical protein